MSPKTTAEKDFFHPFSSVMDPGGTLTTQSFSSITY